jgi:P-type Cu+ transporter
MELVKLKIEGMESSGCAHAVEHAIQMVPGVLRVRADLADGSADVEKAETVTAQQLIDAVEKTGYSARVVA